MCVVTLHDFVCACTATQIGLGEPPGSLWSCRAGRAGPVPLWCEALLQTPRTELCCRTPVAGERRSVAPDQLRMARHMARYAVASYGLQSMVWAQGK